MAVSPAIGGRLDGQYVAGPGPAVASLYERHADRILGFCIYQLGNRSEAEDALQTTFLFALRGLRRGVVPRNEIAWLVTIARNVCRSLKRSSRRRHLVEAPRDPHVMEEIVGRLDAESDELVGLNDALASIPENQRRAIVLREWHGLPYCEIAATMGVSATAVEMLVFRARRSLAGALRGERRTTLGARAHRVLDVGSLFALLRAAVGGVSSAQVAAGAGIFAVIAAGGGAPGPLPGHRPSRLPAVGIAAPPVLRSKGPIVRLRTVGARPTVHLRTSGAPVHHLPRSVDVPAPRVTARAVPAEREPLPPASPVPSPVPREPQPPQIPVEAPQIAAPVSIPTVTLPADVAPDLTADPPPVALP